MVPTSGELPRECAREKEGARKRNSSFVWRCSAVRGEGKEDYGEGVERCGVRGKKSDCDWAEVRKHLEADCCGFQRLRDAEHSRRSWSLPSKETLRGHSDSSFRGEGYIQCCVGVRLCDMYSNQELAKIHFMYGKADGNAALARRLYQERYPQLQCPDRKTFVRLHYGLCEYGKFNSPGLGRGRPRSTTPEVQEEILETVNMTPSISTRRVALHINVPHTTVWRLLKEYQLYPYHLQRVQALSPVITLHELGSVSGSCSSVV
ncbi:hypothetical protein ANN_14622 [Periplaneta americana]|uniref:DUF4817 domain-containing protein n=1 Tax=Periplaneta americana TaxID=6978 RepID=A0ABQ8SYY1_PERAM|nr:hypothetical protein ANN_14622 [Periplaneta americana]